MLTSQSEDDKQEQKYEDVEIKEEVKIKEDNKIKENIKRQENIRKEDIKSTIHPEQTYQKDKSKNVHQRRRRSQQTSSGRTFYDWCALLIQFFGNTPSYTWCVIGGIAISLYLTIVMNETNIFAIVEKDNVASQMKQMIVDLKHDNKILKEQMLAEMKNEKVLSSFEHQIRELRKENSKLNHMLYDVAKVLDKQMYSQEKKEAEYLAPFKKEINKLKEHINILKFDNEELQKQLVRMRYASYSQGGKDTTESKDYARKEDSTKSEKDASTEEIPLDIESLKKWNELISLVTKELGALSAADASKEEKTQSDTKNKNDKPFWKVFFNDFKGTFNDLRKINITTIISDYRKANQKAISDVYKVVKDFFTVEESTQQYTKSDEDGSQWKNIGDFVNDLSEKWTNIKDRLYTSDLKKFFERHYFRKAETGSSHDEYHSQKDKGGSYEHSESKPKSNSFESEQKHDKVQTPESKEWMFERAAHRAELRDTDEEESVNWFLKKGRYTAEDENEERHL